jgi:hypothetical protein
MYDLLFISNERCGFKKIHYNVKRGPPSNEEFLKSVSKNFPNTKKSKFKNV